MMRLCFMKNQMMRVFNFPTWRNSNNASPSGPGNTTGVEAAVNRIANYSGMTITVTYPDGSNSPPNRVRVQIAYPFTTFSLGWTLPTVRASGLGRITF